MNNDATKRPPNEPNTLEEFLWYCLRYSDGIFVREQIDGQWDSVALSSVGPERQAYWMNKWIQEGHVPVRILEPEEIIERDEQEQEGT